jgi:pimeloyl-ACP methyl ester carboxylesterase
VFGPALGFSAACSVARRSYDEFVPDQPDLSPRRLERRYTDDASTFVEVEGTRVHYRDEGPADAPTVLALHGVYSSLHTWDGWVEELGEEYQVVRLDLPGFGLTGPTDGESHSLAEYASFLDAFCARLGLDDVAVAGNSLGGAIAWRFAATTPDRVRRLLLLNAGRQHLVPSAAELFTSPGLDVVPRYYTPRTSIRAILRDAYGDPDRLTEAAVRRYHDLLRRRGNRQAVIDLVRTVEPAPYDPTHVGVPTLVQWGEEDTWLPLDLGEQFAAEIPDATLETYPGVGHVAMEEAPTPTARDAAAFLE